MVCGHLPVVRGAEAGLHLPPVVEGEVTQSRDHHLATLQVLLKVRVIMKPKKYPRIIHSDLGTRKDLKGMVRVM